MDLPFATEPFLWSTLPEALDAEIGWKAKLKHWYVYAYDECDGTCGNGDGTCDNGDNGDMWQW